MANDYFRYDANKKIISTALYLDDNRVFKDTTIYSKYTDTTYSYSNDTMIYNAKRKLKLAAPANTFHREKTTVNYYDEMGNKKKQIVYSYLARERCRSSITDSTGYTITDYFKAADTTIEKVITWLCVRGKETTINKFVRISDRETYKEQWGNRTRISDKLNELNLITARTINQSGNDIKAATTITYNYYFDKSR